MLAGRVKRLRSTGDLALSQSSELRAKVDFAVVYSSLWSGGGSGLAGTGRSDTTSVRYVVDSSKLARWRQPSIASDQNHADQNHADPTKPSVGTGLGRIGR